jgi:serralysin
MCFICQAKSILSPDYSLIFGAEGDVAAASGTQPDYLATAGTTTTSVAATLDRNINGLLIGSKFTQTSMTFSFPTTTADYESGYGASFGQAAFDSLASVSNEMKVAARFGFGLVSQLTGLTITESATPLTSNFRMALFTNNPDGVTGPQGAFAYYPTTSQFGGDSWYSNNTGFTLPTKGNYGWYTIIHELGHNLGLKHGHETGGPANTAMSFDRDSMEFSVMTYKSYIGSDARFVYNEEWGYAQSYMMYDIAALQYMYGADYSTNNTASTYTFSTTTGEMFINGVGQGAPGANRVFLTIWDGGGTDTYDFSNYTTNMSIDLTPGGWSKLSDVQIANLGNGNFARANVFNALQFQGDARSLIENAIGGSGDDDLFGNAIANVLQGGGGNDYLLGRGGGDQLIGGAGVDRASYLSSTAGVYVVVGDSANWTGDAAGDSFSSIEGLIGSDFADVLGMDAGDNQIEGYGGNDRLSGNAGNDVLYGDDGNDLLEGGAGRDYHEGGSGEDTVSYLSATSGIYLVTGDVANWTGDAAGDTFVSIEIYRGSQFSDVIAISQGNDSVFGQEGNDWLSGLNGDDNLVGGAGADLLEGGAGFDFASYQEATVGIYLAAGDLGNSTGEAAGDRFNSIEGIIGTNFADVIGWDAGANTLRGLGGNDRLVGNDGDDVLDGGLGADVLNGGNGLDSASYANSAGAVYVFVGDSGSWTGEAAGDSFVSIEGITGSAFNDVLGLDGGNNVLDGGAGDDTLYGQGGADTLIGGVGFDTASYSTAASGIYAFIGDWGSFTGDARGDTYFSIECIIGTNFNDVIGMDDFANRLVGGAGDDVLYGEGGGDQLFGNDGFDTVSYAFAPSGVYMFYTDLGNATGDAAGDTFFSSIECIVGSSFNDFIGTGSLNDTLAGGGGDDVLQGFAGGDKFYGNDGFDTVSYSLAGASVYVFFADLGNATGDARGDTEFSSIESIIGSNFDDVIGLGGFADTLIGGAGNDTLFGLGGNDTLWGGIGNDLFAYNATSFGNDTIRDFQDGLDRIDFSRVAGVNFASLAINSVAGGVQVGLGASSILISGASISQITAADFLFA